MAVKTWNQQQQHKRLLIFVFVFEQNRLRFIVMTCKCTNWIQTFLFFSYSSQKYPRQNFTFEKFNKWQRNQTLKTKRVKKKNENRKINTSLLKWFTYLIFGIVNLFINIVHLLIFTYLNVAFKILQCNWLTDCVLEFIIFSLMIFRYVWRSKRIVVAVVKHCELN